MCTGCWCHIITILGAKAAPSEQINDIMSDLFIIWHVKQALVWIVQDFIVEKINIFQLRT